LEQKDTGVLVFGRLRAREVSAAMIDFLRQLQREIGGLWQRAGGACSAHGSPL